MKVFECLQIFLISFLDKDILQLLWQKGHSKCLSLIWKEEAAENLYLVTEFCNEVAKRGLQGYSSEPEKE